MDNSNITNCVNCGAVLTSWKCEYCGTEYRKLEVKSIPEVQEDMIETTILKDKRVILNKKTGDRTVIQTYPELDPWTDQYGVLHRC